MKTSKRILCSLLLVVFALANVIVMPVSAATTFTDVEEGSDVQEAVTVLNKLGVINGYDDGTFKPDNNVTRAEFTAMLLRTRGMGAQGSTSLENPPFPDVTTPDVSWAIGNIRTARDLGIVNGYDDGTFKPSNTVSYEEAVKMIVCALGYGEMGTDGAEWYSRYIQSAIQLKFTDGAGGAIGTPATRATIAMMLYNCLEVKLAEGNKITEKTILEADLKLEKNVGFIASNPEISLSSPDASVRADEIQITAPDENGIDQTLTYKVDNPAEYADMLGAQITFYYSEDRGTDTRTLVLATVERSVTVEVDAELIDPALSSTESVAYYKSESANSANYLKIASDSIVVYNDQLYGATDRESTFEYYCNDMGEAAIPLMGSMKFLDRDGDKVYDIVFVESYEAYIASSVTSSTYTVVDNNLRKGLSDNKVVLDPTDLNQTITFVTADGNASSFSAIKTGSVVCVKKSNPYNGGQTIITAVINNNTVSGTVKAINSDDSIKIDSKTYDFSKYAPWINAFEGAEVTMSKPSMSDSGKFYLDMNGDIIGYDKTEQTTNQQYGYIMQVRSKSQALEEILVFDILTQSGSKTAYYAYEDTSIHGETFDTYDDLLGTLAETALPSGDLEDYPEDTDNAEYSQLVKFTTKSYKGNVVIDDIITASPINSGTDISADELYFYENMNATTEDISYHSTNKQLIGEKKISLNSAIMFKIPEDRSDTDAYKKMSFNDFTHNNDYIVEFYDVTGTNSAKVVLVYGGAANAGDVNATSPVMVITDIAREIDPADSSTTRYRMYGYVGSTAVDYWGSTDSEDVLSTLQIGDVVRLGTDDDGYYTVKEEHIIFSVADGYRDVAIEQGGTSEYPKDELGSSQAVDYRVLWGSAYQRDDDLLVVSYDVLAGNESENDIDAYQMTRRWFNNAKIYLFDTTGTELEITEYAASDNASVIDELQLYDGSSTPDELFIHMSSTSSVRTMIIVRRPQAQ